MSGTVLTLGVLAATLSITVATATGCALLVRSAAASGAADAAALAAADAASGRAAGPPCAAAERLAASNGMTLVECRTDGAVVTVVVAAASALLPVRAIATAGPPP